MTEAPDERPTLQQARVDRGFTLVELTLTMVVSGLLVAALSTAITVALRVTPSSEDRIDDARSTRSLSTYLSHDTTSTPPFAPEQAQGGFDVTTTSGPDNNDCGAAGANIVHMQWTEEVFDTRTFVANYRFVVDGATASVVRVTCFAVDGGPFSVTSSRSMTPALDPAAAPAASLSFDAVGNVTVVAFTLTGASGDSVLVETASRNPSDFFTP